MRTITHYIYVLFAFCAHANSHLFPLDILQLALAAAFYPNYFVRGAQGGQIDEKEAVATLAGHDPYSTVYLQGMPVNQPAVLYKQSILEHFQQVSKCANILFDKCGS